MKKVSILGSTGSVGRNALEVVDAFSESLEVVALAAGSNVTLLATQIEKYRPSVVSLRTASDAALLVDKIGSLPKGLEILHGDEGTVAVATISSADTVIAAIVGAAGIPPVYAALKSGKRVAIANKEVLVAAGELMTRTARDSGGEILPVDSEHNAVHQALRCGNASEVERIVLTASGGPFLHRDVDTFDEISIEAALAHPTWKMGNKISIDSATMMNKGLEVIEAHHLFDVPFRAIDILIHPQSIVHSLVEYVDGSFLAQLSTTDMRFPIQYSLLYPERRSTPFSRLDLQSIRTLDFLPVDHERFPAVKLAYEVGAAGGSIPAVMNAANEIAVARFLDGEMSFSGIVELVRRVVDRHASSAAKELGSIEEVLEWDRWARNEAATLDVTRSAARHVASK